MPLPPSRRLCRHYALRRLRHYFLRLRQRLFYATRHACRRYADDVADHAYEWSRYDALSDQALSPRYADV